MIKVFYVALILFFSASCSQKEPKQELAAADLTNLSYGSHDRQKLDVYLPENRNENTKVILLLHGGSWYGGDKSSLTTLAQFFRERGYACVNINYRLAHTGDNNIHPAQVHDVHSALKFIASKASEWKFSSDNVALMGASAGAHIALLYAYAYDTDRKVKTVISVAAPTDFTAINDSTPQSRQALEWLLGASFQENPEIYRQASPISHVSASAKPTLIFHGAKDPLVPVQQARDFKARLDQFNVPNKLIVYEDTGHEVLDLNKLPAFLNEVEQWLTFYLSK